MERVERLSPRLVQVTLAGPELEGLVVPEPAASVRVLLPQAGSDRLVMPEWQGNEYLLPGGARPTIRTLTPRRVDPDVLELDVAVVVHGTGAASGWADTVAPGAPAAVSGPGRGYAVPDDAAAFFLAGDETAVPAISQLLEALPIGTPVQAHLEVADEDARVVLPRLEAASVSWHPRRAGTAPGSALAEAVAATDLPDGTYAWIAGEATAVQRVRRLLFEDRGLPRNRAAVRGYWKHGRTAAADE